MAFLRPQVEIDLHTPGGDTVTAGGHNSEAVESLALPEALTDDNIDTFVEVSRRQGRSYPLVYDHIIRCLGWAHDLSMYRWVPHFKPSRNLP